MKSRLWLGFGFSLALGCATTKVTTLPGGGFRITCDGLADCATRAEKICGTKGVSVVTARSSTKVLGGPSSNYQAAATTAFLEGTCGEPKPAVEAGAGDENAVYTVQASPDASGEPEGAPRGDASGRACVPGASQKCFGPGACEGGQACLPDGSGFGACECAAPTALPAPAPTASSASTPGPSVAPVSP